MDVALDPDSLVNEGHISKDELERQYGQKKKEEKGMCILKRAFSRL